MALFLDQNDVNKRRSVVMYVHVDVEQQCVVVKDDLPAQNGFMSFQSALESATDLKVVDVHTPFDILREKNSIARVSRRGVANLILEGANVGSNNMQTIEDSLTPHVVVREGLTRTYLLYKSPASSLDCGVLRKGDTYWLHPNYKSLITVLNFVGEQDGDHSQPTGT